MNISDNSLRKSIPLLIFRLSKSAMRVFSTLAFWLLVFPLFAQVNITSVPGDPINVKQFKLPNGLTVFLSEKHDVPQVMGAIIVRTGSKKDPADNTGMAHYLEHMLFKGTTELGTTNYEKEKVHLDEINRLYDELGKTKDEAKRLEIQKKINEESVKAAQYAIPNEMDRMLSEIGGEDVNAFTTNEITAYHNTFPSNQMERWLDIYDHRFEKPVFRLFQSELETVYEEKNRGNEEPFTYLFEKFMESFYKVHPYGQQTTIGKTEHLKNPSLTAMYNYFNKWYVANNMALVLCGDFNSEEVIPMIQARFSDWRSAEVPKFPEYKEEPFKGRELITMRATPIKVGALGFRIPAMNQQDEAEMEVILNLLSNGEAGALDRISREGKILQAGTFEMVEQDYGAAIIFFIPKIVGQKLDKAEAIVKAEIEKIRTGNFDPNLLEAVKLSLIKNFQRQWERNDERALAIGSCFGAEINWADYLNYEKNIRKITKEDIMRVANKYLAENYLVLQSKMGKPEKEKLSKPAFEPVIPKEEAHSEYYERWKKIPEGQAKPRFVNFENDIRTSMVGEKISLTTTPNPYNSIFSMRIRFGTGKHYDPIIKFISGYLALASSEQYDVNNFSQRMYELGTSVSSYANEHEFVISIEGLEENLSKSLDLIYRHYTTLKADEKIIKKMASDTEAELKISKRSPSFWSQVLNQYVLLGEKSVYLREPGVSDLKKLKAQQILDAFKAAMQYEVQINFVGNLSHESLKSVFEKEFPITQVKDRKPKQALVYHERNLPKENTIYLLNDKKAVQSQVFFFIEGKALDLNDLPVIMGFNKYFGGDMSSLVFQEIREFRSLAYSTYAQYQAPMKPGQECFFTGYVGCQADKTIDAVSAMNDLIHNMPSKPERWESLQSSLIQSAQSERPDFRSIMYTIEYWKNRGLNKDPNESYIERYKAMNYQNILDFYTANIKGKPMSVTIVGNTGAFDLKALGKFGKIINIDGSKIMKK
jgi:zinc protease